jgi:hypothetical protein
MITSKITNSKLGKAELIRRRGCDDYFYIPASISIEIAQFKAIMVNGECYNHDDRPSNFSFLCDSDSDKILVELCNRTSLSDLDDADFVSEINDRCETSYSADELLDIYLAINECIGDGGNLINDAQNEAQEKMDADTNFYVEYIECEEEDDGRYIQCDIPELKVFATESEARDFIDNVNRGDIAEIVSNQYARAKFPDNF